MPTPYLFMYSYSYSYSYSQSFMYLYWYSYSYMYMKMRMRMYMYMIYMCICMRMCICMCMRVHMCMRMRMCMYMCMYMYMCVHPELGLTAGFIAFCVFPPRGVRQVLYICSEPVVGNIRGNCQAEFLFRPVFQKQNSTQHSVLARLFPLYACCKRGGKSYDHTSARGKS